MAAKFKIGRAVVVAGLGGVAWQGFPRFVQWLNDIRPNCMVIGVDPDVIEERNGSRQWCSSLSGAYKARIWSQMFSMLKFGSYGSRSGASAAGLMGIIGRMGKDGMITHATTGTLYGELGSLSLYPNVFSELKEMAGGTRLQIRLGQMFEEVVDADEIWLLALVDNQVARVWMYDWAESMAAKREGKPVFMVSAGNNKMGGWAACCRMATEEGKVKKEGDWKVFRADIWEGAKAEAEGREEAEGCASMKEQTAGSNGFTAQCLFGVIGAAENDWFGEYTWRYRTPEEAAKQGHGVTMVMIERK